MREEGGERTRGSDLMLCQRRGKKKGGSEETLGDEGRKRGRRRRRPQRLKIERDREKEEGKKNEALSHGREEAG